jgi:hypothetical protein
MRVVMLEAPPEVEAMLAERRRLGLDVFDEMWGGASKLEITWDGGSATV